VSKLKELPADDPYRIRVTEKLLAKLHGMGLIAVDSSLAKAERLSVSAFCRCARAGTVTVTVCVCVCMRVIRASACRYELA
jgi:U3 small nucleolar ribonucleoprotein protein IMP3